MTLQSRYCAVLYAAYKATGRSQRELGEQLAQVTGEAWPQSRVNRLLLSRSAFPIDALAAAAQVLGVSIAGLADPVPIPEPVTRAIDAMRRELCGTQEVFVVVISERKPAAAGVARSA